MPAKQAREYARGQSQTWGAKRAGARRPPDFNPGFGPSFRCRVGYDEEAFTIFTISTPGDCNRSRSLQSLPAKHDAGSDQRDEREDGTGRDRFQPHTLPSLQVASRRVEPLVLRRLRSSRILSRRLLDAVEYLHHARPLSRLPSSVALDGMSGLLGLVAARGMVYEGAGIRRRPEDPHERQDVSSKSRLHSCCGPGSVTAHSRHFSAHSSADDVGPHLPVGEE